MRTRAVIGEYRDYIAAASLHERGASLTLDTMQPLPADPSNELLILTALVASALSYALIVFCFPRANDAAPPVLRHRVDEPPPAPQLAACVQKWDTLPSLWSSIPPHPTPPSPHARFRIAAVDVQELVEILRDKNPSGGRHAFRTDDGGLLVAAFAESAAASRAEAYEWIGAWSNLSPVQQHVALPALRETVKRMPLAHVFACAPYAFHGIHNNMVPLEDGLIPLDDGVRVRTIQRFITACDAFTVIVKRALGDGGHLSALLPSLWSTHIGFLCSHIHRNGCNKSYYLLRIIFDAAAPSAAASAALRDIALNVLRGDGDADAREHLSAHIEALMAERI